MLLQIGKLIAAGLAVSSISGAGTGIGIVFGCLILGTLNRMNYLLALNSILFFLISTYVYSYYSVELSIMGFIFYSIYTTLSLGLVLYSLISLIMHYRVNNSLCFTAVFIVSFISLSMCLFLCYLPLEPYSFIGGKLYLNACINSLGTFNLLPMGTNNCEPLLACIANCYHLVFTSTDNYIFKTLLVLGDINGINDYLGSLVDANLKSITPDIIEVTKSAESNSSSDSVITYLLASVGILFLGALGYFCYVYLGVSSLEVGVPTKLPAVLEVVTAQTSALSEVPAVSSVVSQKVEAEVLLREVTPDVESTVFNDVQRAELKNMVDTSLKETTERAERRFAGYAAQIISFQNEGKPLTTLPVYQSIYAQEVILQEITKELSIASKKLDTAGVSIEDIDGHLIKNGALVAELNRLLKMK